MHIFVHKYLKMSSYCPYFKSLLGASFEIKSLSFQLVAVQNLFPCYSLVFSERDYYGLRHVHLLFSVQCFLGKLSQVEILISLTWEFFHYLSPLHSEFKFFSILAYHANRSVYWTLSPCLYSHCLSLEEEM